MKRFAVLLFSCVVLAGSAWLAHAVWGQTAETKEKTYTITQSQLDKYVADQIAKAVAADREKAPRDKDRSATDEQVLKSENWHRAVFNKAEFVIYTGPGQAMFHHWVESAAKPPAAKGGAAAPSAAKGGAATPAASKGN
jgi:hypothetical protein